MERGRFNEALLDFAYDAKAVNYNIERSERERFNES